MSGIDLKKSVEQVGIVLTKRNILTPPTARVGVALDVSGSAEWMYKPGGIIQQTLNRLVAIGLTFDDNGELDVWAFSNNFKHLDTLDEHNYNDYVTNVVRKNQSGFWGGTYYAPIWQDVVNFYGGAAVPQPAQSSKPGFFAKLFGAKEVAPVEVSVQPTEDPAVLFFITDGANSDRQQARKVITDAQRTVNPIYFVMVGVGDPTEFGFLEELADDLPNVGYINLSDLDISESELYDGLIGQELCTWLTSK